MRQALNNHDHRCLRKEFKHGVPQAQERAAKVRRVLPQHTEVLNSWSAQLLVVLWRNTTDRFRRKSVAAIAWGELTGPAVKIADKKFTKQLEQTIKSHNTESPVRKTLYKAVAVLAWESHVSLLSVNWWYIALRLHLRAIAT